MKNIEIIRLEENFEFGTFGVVKIDKQVFCVSLEPPDLLNKYGQSSIPAQQYMCQKWESPKFGLTYKILNVPNRDDVLFHAGNKKIDTRGCPLVGQYFDKFRGDRAILNSGATFRRFLAKLLPDEFVHLTIKEEY